MHPLRRPHAALTFCFALLAALTLGAPAVAGATPPAALAAERADERERDVPSRRGCAAPRARARGSSAPVRPKRSAPAAPVCRATGSSTRPARCAAAA